MNHRFLDPKQPVPSLGGETPVLMSKTYPTKFIKLLKGSSIMNITVITKIESFRPFNLFLHQLLIGRSVGLFALLSYNKSSLPGRVRDQDHTLFIRALAIMARVPVLVLKLRERLMGIAFGDEDR
ncbi:hypothetical protein Tco_0787909 [Tanacetum coccineum]